MRTNIFLIIIFISNIIYSQEMYSVNSEKTIVVIDSLNFKDPLKISRYFVYDYNKSPFSGKMIIKYRDFYIDTLEIINGYQNGFEKLVEQKTNQVISYSNLNQNELIIYSLYKKSKEATYFNYKTNGVDFFIKKRRNKIRLILKCNNKKINKIYFSDNDKLCKYLENEKMESDFIFYIKSWI
ncbi:MAG: hypothetical protein RIQ59_482 [Bacteroidota bacterium]